MIITELANKDRSMWDDYVRTSIHGLPMHLSGWQDVMHKSYGYKTHYLIAKDGEKVVGVMPLFIVRSFLMGDTVMTMPGGICVDDPDIAKALIERGLQISQRANVKRLVVQDAHCLWQSELHTSANHVHWVVDVSIGTDAMWKRLHKNDRRQVRMARRNGLTVQIDRMGEYVDDFYSVLSRCSHQIGTPLFGKFFLDNVINTFPGGFNIVIVRNGMEPIGAYFQLEMGDTVYGTWGATLREYLDQRAVYLAYWEILSDTCMKGFHYLDMGRSPAGSNISKYKGRWGGESSPVYQQIATFGNQDQANGIADRVNSEMKFKYFIQIWSKLPFSMVQFIGPKLRSHVPFA